MRDDFTYAILPAVLGISLAGFAIVVSQIDTDTMNRVANDTIKTIFTSGQVANFLYVKSKVETDAASLTENEGNGEGSGRKGRF